MISENSREERGEVSNTNTKQAPRETPAFLFFVPAGGIDIYI
jgi:hypothetical protein